MGDSVAIRRIQKNIDESGYHLYFVAGGPVPRFVYTIGLSEKIGFELVLAGSSYFDDEDASQIDCKFVEDALVSPEMIEMTIKIERRIRI